MKRKSILKEAGVLLIAAILVLTVVVTVPMKATQTSDHDVGVTAIISPTTGPMQTYPVEVTVKNFGTNDEFFPVNVVIEKNAVVDYDQTIYISINAGQSMNATFPSWYPSDLGKYQVTASTQLSGDENPSNDWLNKTIYIVIEFMGLEVAPLGQANIAVVNGSLNVSHCVSNQNNTDGVWTNLEDQGNLFETWLEYPAINGSSMTIDFVGEPNASRGEPVPGAEIFIEQEPSDEPILWGKWDNMDVQSVTVEAFNNGNLVFYKEHIDTEQNGCLSIGYVNHQLTTLGPGVKLDKQGGILSLSCKFQSPEPWCWKAYGVNNLPVTLITMRPDRQNKTTPKLSYATTYSKGITAFTVATMHAEVNNPPSAPTINGPASGKIKQNYNYTVVSTDPEGNNISYFVDWGNGSNMSVVGPYPSNEQVTLSHSWSIKGTYTIRTKAMDQYYSESTWASLKVTMPFSYQPPNHPFLSWLFERFPHAFPILRHLLGY